MSAPSTTTFGRFIMPSLTLSLYIAKMYAARFLGMLIGLISILQLLDLMAVSDTIMAAEGATGDEIARYVSLRLPQLLSQFIPFSALFSHSHDFSQPKPT